MQILMISPEPFFQPRGTPLSVLHRLFAITSLGHKVDLLTYSIGEDVEIPGVTILRIPRIPFVQNIKIGPSYVKVLLDLMLFIRAFFLLCRKRYDLIHSHEEASFFTVILAFLFRTKNLYDMHSSLPQQLSNFNFSNSKPLIKLFETLERIAINRCDALITICPELEEYVKKINPLKKQIMIENVADGNPLEENKEKNINLRDKYSLSGKKVIVYTGTFEAYQGLELLVESARIVLSINRDVVFMLIGGKQDQIKGLKDMASEKGVSDFFVFTGAVPFNQVSDYIKAADFLVSPRIRGNNTPLKIYSYLKSGKPIIATNLSTHTQVLSSDLAVLVEPTPKAFAEGILAVLNDSKLCDTLAENAKKIAEEKYSYEIYLKRTKEILEAVSSS
jgi:glycosyltransferase involved in cell wall biosynthesis